MKPGTARGASAMTWSVRIALILLFAACCAAGCGGGGDEAEKAPHKALVPGALDDTLHAPEDTTAWQEMGEVPAAEQVTEELAVPEETADRPVVQAEVPAQETVRQAEVAPAPAGGPFVLQLGSFRSLENARNLAERIRQLGYDPTLETSTLGGQTYHRVILGGLPDRAEATSLGERIHAELGITYLVRRVD